MNIQTIKLDQLNPAEYNPRTITKEEFEGLKESLKAFGQQENLIVNKDMTVISGHQRLEAMKALGWNEAVCNMVDLDKHAEKKFNVIMNSTAISGKYDDLKLSEILEELKLDDDYESLRLNELEPLDLSPTEVEEDEAPEVSSEPAVSKQGEIYKLGRHRVMCGSATNEDDVDKLLSNQKIDLYLTDPPYNVAYTGKTKEALTIENDEMDDGEFLAFLADAFRRADEHMKSGAAFYIFHADSEGYNFRAAVKETGWVLKQCLIWVKQTMVMGRQDYQWKHEPILYGWKSGSSHSWYADRKQTTVLNFDRPQRNGEHPTMKPIAILSYLIDNSSKAGDLVYDSFSGSGSGIIACEQTNRTCYGMELDPKYVDVIRKRYWKFINGSEEGWQDGTSD